MNWETEVERIEAKAAFGLLPDNRVEWEARIYFDDEGDQYTWRVERYLPTNSYAEGFENSESDAMEAVRWQISRWRGNQPPGKEICTNHRLALEMAETAFANWDGPHLLKVLAIKKLEGIIELMDTHGA